MKNSWTFVLALLLLSASHGWAGERAGEVVSRVGAPEIRRGEAWGPLAQGDAVEVGDRIRTGAGRVKVLLLDDTVLTLDQNTELSISQHLFRPQQKSRQGTFTLWSGRLKALVGSFLGESDVRIKTPTAVAGVRGTHFVVEVVPEKTADANGSTGTGAGYSRVTVLEGKVILENEAGKLELDQAMLGALGLGGVVEKARTMSQGELDALYRSIDFRSAELGQSGSAGAADGAVAGAGQDVRNARTLGSSGPGTGGSVNPGARIGTGPDAARGGSTGVRPDNDVPPANQESFEPGRGGANIKIQWPR